MRRKMLVVWLALVHPKKGRKKKGAIQLTTHKLISEEGFGRVVRVAAKLRTVFSVSGGSLRCVVGPFARSLLFYYLKKIK